MEGLAWQGRIVYCERKKKKETKNCDTLKNYHNCPKNGTLWFFRAVIQEQSDVGLHCFFRAVIQEQSMWVCTVCLDLSVSIFRAFMV